jgi:hypothetical protein
VQGDLLAQRAIDREWGPSDDSTYRVIDVPGWKSEGGAFVLSGVVPGAGQIYVGENSGWAFAAGEVAFWLGHWYEVVQQRNADRSLAAFIGNPYDSSATFSFARYRTVSHNSSAELERLWSGDRAGFYRALNDNADYRAGFDAINADNLASSLHGMVVDHDVASHRQWLFDAAVWANHLLAAFDALRAARAHNAPLREEYKIELGERWRDGQHQVCAAIVRRF